MTTIAQALALDAAFDPTDRFHRGEHTARALGWYVTQAWDGLWNFSGRPGKPEMTGRFETAADAWASAAVSAPASVAVVAQPVQQAQARARAPKPARGERRYVTVRDIETGEVHRVLTSVARVGVAVVIFVPSNRHRAGALGGMLITHDDIRKAWVFNDEAEARRCLSSNRALGERVIRAELISDPAPAMVPQPCQQQQGRARSAFDYSPWRHGGWYVHNVRYPSGAIGCVSRNYDDGKWRIVCDPRPNAHQLHTYRTRDEAARAELALVATLPARA
jgi:hypothetical protein